MLIINKSKPFYSNKNKKIIRMGNFPSTGKEIFYEDDAFLSLFNFIQEPITKEKLIDKMISNFKISKEEIEDVINYLIEEKFVINYEEYKNIVDNNKYNRQDLFFSMFNGNYSKKSNELKNKKVLILGLGGIGSNSAIMLYKSGFNDFTLVDYDKVDETNLIRQFPYSEKDIGKYKTDCMKEILINANVKIKNIQITDKESIEEEIKNSDFVLCTVDRPLRIIRRLINNVCVAYNKPVLFCGFTEHVGMIGPLVVPKETACLECIERKYSEEPFNNISLVPSYGPLCFMISSVVCNEIINYFIKYNVNNNLIGKTLMFDLYTYKTKIIKWKKKNNCKECGNASK